MGQNNVFDEALEEVGGFLGDGANALGEVFTDIGEGVVQFFDESIGEVTGRNQQREALTRQEERYEQEEITRAKLLEEEQEMIRKEDVASSSQAGKARSRSQRRSTGSTSSSTQKATLGGTRDFLGL